MFAAGAFCIAVCFALVNFISGKKSEIPAIIGGVLLLVGIFLCLGSVLVYLIKNLP
jgi:hypothetical protein